MFELSQVQAILLSSTSYRLYLKGVCGKTDAHNRDTPVGKPDLRTFQIFSQLSHLVKNNRSGSSNSYNRFYIALSLIPSQSPSSRLYRKEFSGNAHARSPVAQIVKRHLRTFQNIAPLHPCGHTMPLQPSVPRSQLPLTFTFQLSHFSTLPPSSSEPHLHHHTRDAPVNLLLHD